MRFRLDEMGSGLFEIKTGQPIPLTGVEVFAEIQGCASSVLLRQRFRNTEEVAVEAVYVFPLPEAAALSGVVIESGGRRITGRVEERAKAFEFYDHALAQGHGAVLLDQERPNVFTVSVGNLLPEQELTVELQWVAELERTGEALRFVLPTTVAPRYAPMADTRGGEPTDTNRLSPPLALEVPYSMEFTARVTHPSGILAVDSPSHCIQCHAENGAVRVELGTGQVAMDRDVVLLIKPQKLGEPFVQVARTSSGSRVVAAHFVPDVPVAEGKREFFFLLDCSGSMEGSSIAQAKQAVKEALGALTEQDTFAIVVFGSTVAMLTEQPRPANSMWLTEAQAKLNFVDANLGGTELLQALDFALRWPPDASRERVIVLITDGEITNEAEVFRLVRKSCGENTRVFVVGVGYGPNEHLVRSLARAGYGAAEMVHPNEPIAPALLRQMQKARAPRVDQVKVQWVGSDPEWQAPEELTILPNESLTVYGSFRGRCPQQVVIEAQTHGRPWTLRLAVPKTASNSALLPLLAARAAIRSWEEQMAVPGFRGSARDDRRQEVLAEKIRQLALQYNLVSSYTSLVAVEERQGASQEGIPELRRIPIALTHGWHGTSAVPKPSARLGGFPGAGPGQPTSSSPDQLFWGISPDTSLTLRSTRPAFDDLSTVPPCNAVPIPERLYHIFTCHREDYRSQLLVAMAQDPVLVHEVLELVDTLLSLRDIKECYGTRLVSKHFRGSNLAFLPADKLAALSFYFLADQLLQAVEDLHQKQPQGEAVQQKMHGLRVKLADAGKFLETVLAGYQYKLSEAIEELNRSLGDEKSLVIMVPLWNPVPGV